MKSQTQPVSSGADQRDGPRIALMLRVGKLCLPSGEFLCVVRDASHSGIKVRLFHPLPPHDQAVLELGTGDSFSLEPVWNRDGHAGYRFRDGTIDLMALVDEAGPFPRRHLRIRLDRPVTMTIQGSPVEATLRDISQHGVLVDHSDRLPIGQAVELEAAGLPRLDGRIRWRMGRAHGIVLQRSFRLDELATLAATLQQASC